MPAPRPRHPKPKKCLQPTPRPRHARATPAPVFCSPRGTIDVTGPPGPAACPQHRLDPNAPGGVLARAGAARRSWPATAARTWARSGRGGSGGAEHRKAVGACRQPLAKGTLDCGGREVDSGIPLPPPHPHVDTLVEKLAGSTFRRCPHRFPAVWFPEGKET
eukprot:gene2278-biopygen6467